MSITQQHLSPSQKESEQEMSMLCLSPPDEEAGSMTNDDALLVSWDADDPTYPKNWPRRRKTIATLLASLGGLATLMSGTMMAPALEIIANDLDIGPDAAQMTLSIFVLSFSFAPLVLAPCTEIFGRKLVWLIAAVWYIAWNTVCGFASSQAVMIAARFFAGIGASVNFAICMPIVGDCYSSGERGRAVATMNFIPLLGPALGPILAGFITQHISWHWLFFILSMYMSLIIILVLIFFPETHGPTLLVRKAKALRKQTGKDYRIEANTSGQGLRPRLLIALTRPIRLLATQPVLQMLSIYAAISFGLLYIALSTFASMFQTHYHESISISGLNYIALVIGYIIASQGGGRFTDIIWKGLKAQNNGTTCAEYRVPLMCPSAILMPAGLLWYGWSAENGEHWIMPDLGVMIYGCGTILSQQAANQYVIEAFEENTASALAATQLVRNIFAFASPIFAPAMFTTMGYGWGNSLLALVTALVGIPVPCVLWIYGSRLRERRKRWT